MNSLQRHDQPILVNRASSEVLSRFMSRVYAWMTLGVLVTGFVSFFVGQNPQLVARIMGNSLLFWGIIILQFGSVIYLTYAFRRISAAAAAITFLAYSALTGLTLSTIFMIYTRESILSAFLTAATGFAGLSVFGYVTKRDLGPVGSFCLIGLFGLIGLQILTFFMTSLQTSGTMMAISVMAILVFAGLTAYDTQKIKSMAQDTSTGFNQQAIFGALILYLDFLNLFIYILQLMGRRK